MSDERRVSVKIVMHHEMPSPNLSRMIWQPVADKEGLKMRLAPLSWQPSGAHHALEFQAARIEALTAERDEWKRAYEEADDQAERTTTERDALAEKLAQALDVADTLSGLVEYDYHGNVIGEDIVKAVTTLAAIVNKLKEEKNK